MGRLKPKRPRKKREDNNSTRKTKKTPKSKNELASFSEKIQHPSVIVRSGVVHQIKFHDAHLRKQFIMKALESNDPYTKRAAIGQIKFVEQEKQAFEIIESVLRKHPDEWIRRDSLLHFEEAVFTPERRDFLIQKALVDESELVRKAGIMKIRFLSDPKAKLFILERAIKHEVPRVIKAAIKEISELENEEDRIRLSKLALNHPDRDIVMSTVHVLQLSTLAKRDYGVKDWIALNELNDLLNSGKLITAQKRKELIKRIFEA